MLGFYHILTALVTLFILSSPAASWSITLYETMADCLCTSGPCRQTYLSYEGSSGRSDCIHPGFNAGNSNCMFTTDGGVTFGPCDHDIGAEAFAIGPDTQCAWGTDSDGANSVTQYDEGNCYEFAVFEPEVLSFSCSGSSDPFWKDLRSHQP